MAPLDGGCKLGEIVIVYGGLVIDLDTKLCKCQKLLQ